MPSCTNEGGEDIFTLTTPPQARHRAYFVSRQIYLESIVSNYLLPLGQSLDKFKSICPYYKRLLLAFLYERRRLN